MMAVVQKAAEGMTGYDQWGVNITKERATG